MSDTADRIESLFAAAVALPPEAREAFLEHECAGDAGLFERLVRLLRAHDRVGHVIDQPLGGDPDQTAGYTPMSEQPGTIIAGRYKLLEEIGQGGMGTVWAAEQTTPVRRKVALKLIRAGMDSRSVLARFEAERQALALMDHPNIAKVIDGGLTESGRPYFVMEYVKGVPITEYCDATRLSVEERLNLFIQVCSALQHAHQKGIIHRDLKPSNILVAPYDDKPVPKVIDFGLAKAMHQSLTEKTLYTAHEMVLGTPLYMSPEQAQLNNLDVDTRADIYSLGVLLYELLTGTTPLERKRLREAAWDEIRRMIREEEPPAPSTRLSSTDTLPSLASFRHTEPAKLKKLVRGELDWIVMKALEKDRTRRYETAVGLARDIQRYLDDEVVEARPPSTGYRFRKFVRRHKAQVIAAGLVLLALLAGIAGTTWGLFREARAKTRLAESLDREQKANADLSAANAKVQARYDLAVDAIKTFHTGVSEDFLLKEEKFKDLRNRLLKSASDFYGKLGALLGQETDFRSRRALAQSNFELAELTRKVGRYEDALTNHRAVLAAREALAAEPEADIEAKLDVGRSLHAVAIVLELAGKYVDARATYRRAELVLSGLARSEVSARAALAGGRTRLARLLHYEGKPAESMELLKLARADWVALAAAPKSPDQFRRGLADSFNELGDLLFQTNKPVEAVSEHRAAIAILQRLAVDNSSVSAYRQALSTSHFSLGLALMGTGTQTEAESELRKAIEIGKRLSDDHPAVTALRGNVAKFRMHLGHVLSFQGKSAEAEAELRTAVAIYEKLEESNVDLGSRFNLAYFRCNLGKILLASGRWDEAEAECRLAVASLEKLRDEYPESIGSNYQLILALNNLGDAVRSRGRADEAKRIYNRAIELSEKLPRDGTGQEEHDFLPRTFWRRGLAFRDLGASANAAADLRRALALYERWPPQSGWEELETACCRAALAGLAGLARSGVTEAERESHALGAMDWLRRATAKGYRNLNQLQTESALDALRDRDDFKKLLAELVTNSSGQQGKK